MIFWNRYFGPKKKEIRRRRIIANESRNSVKLEAYADVRQVLGGVGAI